MPAQGQIPIPKGATVGAPTQSNNGAVSIPTGATIGEPGLHPLTPLEKFEVQHPDITGAAKALLNVFGGVGASVFKPAAVVQQLATGQVNPTLQHLATPPEGAAGAAGNLAGQIGQFMIPGPAEAKAATAIREALPGVPAIVREGAALTPQVASAAAINKLQGGTATGGAVAGALGGAVGKLLEPRMPSIAESALGVGERARGFQKTPGAAALAETTGYSPGKIAESADKGISNFYNSLKAKYQAYTQPVSMAPALKVVTDLKSAAYEGQDEALLEFANKLEKRLTVDLKTGEPLGDLSPMRILKIKQRVGDMPWNPDMNPSDAIAAKRQVYHALDSQLDAAVPEGAQANQIMSSLIEIRDAASKKARGSEALQRAFHRMAAHTGAMAGPVAIGYATHNLPMGIAAAGLSSLGIEAAMNPALRMWLARNAPSVAREAPRILLPVGREITSNGSP